MSLADRLATPPVLAHNGRSIIDVWADTLAPTDREALMAAATDTRWRHIDLAEEIVKAGGPEVAETTIRTWRKKRGYRVAR